jgi:Spy/CpxP family protein refolding chaperone
MRTLSTLTTCGLLLAALALAGPGAAQPAEKPAAKADEAAGSAPARGPRNGWWNDPKVVEQLTLSEEQRKKMDGYYESFREALRAGEGREARSAFTEALKAGNWKKARSSLAELSKESSLPVQIHGELKIDILSTLSKEQLAKLVEGYPRLIAQPWVRIPPRRGGPPRQRGGANR